VADVHPKGHLWLAAVTAEVALTDQETKEEADRTIIRVGRGGLIWEG
jgi:hypothetical protein